MRKKWGEYKVLLKGKGWWFKRLRFENGKKTNFHKHQKRDEVWTIYVPAGCYHQIGGKGDVFELAIGKPKERDNIKYNKKIK